MREVEIFFDDLTPAAQAKVLIGAGIMNKDEANWDVFPIFTLEFDDFEDEEDFSDKSGLIEFFDGGEVHWA